MQSLSEMLADDIKSRSKVAPAKRLENMLESVKRSETISVAKKAGLTLLLTAAALAPLHGEEPSASFDTKYINVMANYELQPDDYLSNRSGYNGIAQTKKSLIANSIAELGKSGYEFKGTVITRRSRFYGVEQQLLVFQKEIVDVAKAAQSADESTPSLAGKGPTTSLTDTKERPPLQK